MKKEELIEEIKEQLKGLSQVSEASAAFQLDELLAVLDLRFRLKCKLYELTKEENSDEW